MFYYEKINTNNMNTKNDKDSICHPLYSKTNYHKLLELQKTDSSFMAIGKTKLKKSD